MSKLIVTKIRSKGEESTQDASGLKINQLKKQLKRLSVRYHHNSSKKEKKFQRTLGSAGKHIHKKSANDTKQTIGNNTTTVKFKMELTRTKLSFLKERLKVVLRNCPVLIKSLEEGLLKLNNT